ncbi:MAG: AAA family ATPase [Halobacteria archaeon]|nr:AAA family ATPase [Halobacteria archaeon]
MRVALTGTPGTGKTTVCEPLAERLGLEGLAITDLVESGSGFTQGYDEEYGVPEVDVEAVREEIESEEDVLVEGHLSHLVDVDHTVVLRCRPDVLEERLSERGYDRDKLAENSESEALDVVLAEAVEEQGDENVYEIDTTDKTVEETVEEAAEAVEKRESKTGVVDWIEYVRTDMSRDREEE